MIRTGTENRSPLRARLFSAIFLFFVQFAMFHAISANRGMNLGVEAGFTDVRVVASVQPENLTCEYLIDPVGLDVERPRFSWTLSATFPDSYGQRQTAYQIWVSSSWELLEDGKGDMWNSGWVSSDQMQLIEYEGKSLQSNKTYYWKVAVKDERGDVSDTREIAN